MSAGRYQCTVSGECKLISRTMIADRAVTLENAFPYSKLYTGIYSMCSIEWPFQALVEACRRTIDLHHPKSVDGNNYESEMILIVDDHCDRMRKDFLSLSLSRAPARPLYLIRRNRDQLTSRRAHITLRTTVTPSINNQGVKAILCDTASLRTFRLSEVAA